jgi:hypothetical protein
MEAFLNGYRQLAQERSQKKELALQKFQSDFLRLKEGFGDIKHRAEKEGRLHAPGFNIFSVLRLERYEEHTHSAFIAHLLNPKASHGQGFIFLHAFFKYCNQKFQGFPIPAEELEMGQWEIFTELQVPPFGRLDIVFRSPNLNHLYVIENKVDAWEQNLQLKRYDQWLTRQRKHYANGTLMYLTPSIRRAYSAEGISYYHLSYHEDIVAWLEITLPKIDAPSVKEIVKQYRDLARIL